MRRTSLSILWKVSEYYCSVCGVYYSSSANFYFSKSIISDTLRSYPKLYIALVFNDSFH